MATPIGVVVADDSCYIVEVCTGIEVTDALTMRTKESRRTALVRALGEAQEPLHIGFNVGLKHEIALQCVIDPCALGHVQSLVGRRFTYRMLGPGGEEARL